MIDQLSVREIFVKGGDSDSDTGQEWCDDIASSQVFSQSYTPFHTLSTADLPLFCDIQFQVFRLQPNGLLRRLLFYLC